ncbi:MAG: autotransporter domain-containing protein [Candidatus Omnitrophica bacterium]|nr:autotransporter domain-containing protein [Candidatus Omnitrophota bacterium]
MGGTVSAEGGSGNTAAWAIDLGNNANVTVQSGGEVKNLGYAVNANGDAIHTGTGAIVDVAGTINVLRQGSGYSNWSNGITAGSGSAVTIESTGHINTYTFGSAAVSLANGGTVTNHGTLTTTNEGGLIYGVVSIMSGNSKIINNNTITNNDGTYAIYMGTGSSSTGNELDLYGNSAITGILYNAGAAGGATVNFGYDGTAADATANTVTTGNIGSSGSAWNGRVWGGANHVTGTSTFNTLQVDLDAALTLDGASVTTGNLTADGMLNIAGGATVGSLFGSGTVANTGAIDRTLTVGDDTSTTFFGTIADGGGAGKLFLTKQGAGTLTLSGTSTYTGATTINGGVIDITADNALGTGAVTINDGTALLFGTVGYDAGSVEISNSINVAGAGDTGIGAINNAGGNNTIKGAIVTTGDASIGSISSTLTITGNITSADNYDLTFTGESNISVEGVIGIGSGSVIKEGTGGLYLSAANTYTGNTTINTGGIIARSSDALGVDSDITVADRATLVLETDLTDVTIANNIISVQGIGPGNYGAIVNSGDNNTISGSITQAGDTTIYSDNGKLTISGAIGGVHALTLAGDGDIDISGVIGEVTGLTKDDGGILTLSGANTYTGATTVNAGILEAGVATQAFGDISEVTVATGATLSLNNFDETIASLSGSGTVNNGGAADKTLTVGNIPLARGNTSTTFSGLIADGGGGRFALVKDGIGVLILDTANTFTGGTTITAGTLQVSNANAVGTGDLTNNATLSVGTTGLSVDGTYTQNAGSALDLTANSSSAFGNITSLCDAVVDAGSTVNVTVGGYMPNNTTLKIINGTGGLNVAVPTTITSSNPKYTFTGLSSNGDLILTVSRLGTGFEPDGRDPNGKKVGKVLDDVVDPTPDMRDVLDTLDSMSNTDVGQALSTFTPVVDSGVTNVSNTAIVQFIGASEDRLVNLYAQARQAEETGVSTGSKGSSGFEAWGRGFGQAAHQDARGNSNGYSATIWGTALGGDIPAFHEKVRFGGSGGYAASNVNSKDNSGKTYINSYQSTFYGGYIDPEKPYYVNGAFAFAYNTYKSKRDIAVGTIARRANSSYRGQQYSVLFDGGYTFKTKHVNITPIASLQYLHLHLQKYTETGADALNLSVAKQDYDMLQSGLGAKLDHPFEFGYGTLTPEVHARWLHDFINDNQDTTSTFAGGGGSFATQGFTPARDALNVGGRLTLVTKGNWSVDANYDFEYKQDYTSHTGWADIRYKF